MAVLLLILENYFNLMLLNFLSYLGKLLEDLQNTIEDISILPKMYLSGVLFGSHHSIC